MKRRNEDLIHNLEHGHVWISCNPTLISSLDLAALEQFVTADGTNTGVILTPRPKNTDVVAAASWGRLLTLDRFDAAELRDFVVANRGHAPEGFIVGFDRPDAEPPLDGLPHTLYVPFSAEYVATEVLPGNGDSTGRTRYANQ